MMGSHISVWHDAAYPRNCRWQGPFLIEGKPASSSVRIFWHTIKSSILHFGSHPAERSNILHVTHTPRDISVPARRRSLFPSPPLDSPLAVLEDLHDPLPRDRQHLERVPAVSERDDQTRFPVLSARVRDIIYDVIRIRRVGTPADERLHHRPLRQVGESLPEETTDEKFVGGRNAIVRLGRKRDRAVCALEINVTGTIGSDFEQSGVGVGLEQKPDISAVDDGDVLPTHVPRPARAGCVQRPRPSQLAGQPRLEARRQYGRPSTGSWYPRGVSSSVLS